MCSPWPDSSSETEPFDPEEQVAAGVERINEDVAAQLLTRILFSGVFR